MMVLKMDLQLSIIVPVYNVEKYLQRCIDSLLNQSISNYEIILVDDGSKDKSSVICDAYAQAHPFIHVLHKENEGLGYARNSGLAMAKGKYVSFIDSDDMISSEHFSRLLESAKKNCADVCLGGTMDVYKTQKVANPHPFAGRVFNRQEIMEILLPSMLGYDEYGGNYSGMSVCSGIYNREIIERNNIWFYSEREYISEDAIFNIEFMSHSNTAAVIDSVGYHYYHNSGTLTTTYKQERFEQIKKLFQYEMEIVKTLENCRSLYSRIESMFLANLRVTIMQEIDHNSSNWWTSRKKLKAMIHDECVQTVIKRYDYSNMPIKQKLFCRAICKRSVFLVYVMALFQAHKKRKSYRIGLV